jgi:outer membrane protein assembly factor BamA
VVSGSGLAGGVGYRQFDLGGTGLGFEVGGMVSVRRYQEYQASFGFVGGRSTSLELDAADRRAPSLFNDSTPKTPGGALYVDARYRDFPQHIYYGPGIRSRGIDRSDYALTGLSLDAVAQYQLLSSLGVSARTGVLNLHLGRGRNGSLVDVGDRFPVGETPGALDPPSFVTMGLGAVYDTRPEPRLPDGGVFLSVAVRRFFENVAADLDFTRVTVDARHYLTPFTGRGVLALRGLVSSDYAGDGATPFYLQQSLGGSEILRGYSSYRFQDQSLVAATVEYRWRIHRFVDVAPFLDVGTVAPSLSRVSASAFKATPGVGIRTRTQSQTIFRLDWGYSSEGHRVVFATGPLF